jgi:hypothetical protein
MILPMLPLAQAISMHSQVFACCFTWFRHFIGLASSQRRSCQLALCAACGHPSGRLQAAFGRFCGWCFEDTPHCMGSMEQLSAAGMPLPSAWELWLILGCTVPCALRNLRLLHLSGGLC